MNNTKYQVWMSGGGTQSWGIAALIIQGRLPRPDFAVISDTGREKQSTWDYMDEGGKPMRDLRAAGINLVRIKAIEWSTQGIGLFYGGGQQKAKIPAISFSENQKGSRMTNFCTTEWKVEPIDRWLSKVHGITRSKYVKWLGYSKDEPRRWIRKMKSEEYGKGLIRLPLVTGVPFSRSQCAQIVKTMGWPPPPRSACWCCPNQSDDEWLRLIKESPEEFQKAINLEKELQQREPEMFLHPSGVPLDKVVFKSKEESDLFTRPCDSGVCFV